MKSILTEDFIKCFRKLPVEIQHLARKNYQLWKSNPNHPSLEFKKVHRIKSVYSVRIGIGWRVLGNKQKDFILWFWIGLHEDYTKIIKRL